MPKQNSFSRSRTQVQHPTRERSATSLKSLVQVEYERQVRQPIGQNFDSYVVVDGNEITFLVVVALEAGDTATPS